MKSAETTTVKRGVVNKEAIGDFFRVYGTLFALVLVVIFFAAVKPRVFPTWTNTRNILQQVSILGVIATTQTIVMCLNDFDVSVGTLGSLVGVTVGALMNLGWAPPLAMLIGLAVGATAGFTNGFFVAIAGLSPFVATLATMTAFEGVSFLVAHGTTLFGFPTSFQFLGSTGHIGPIPLIVVIAAVVLFLGWFAMTRMSVGRRWYAIGGNRDAAFLSGVRVMRLRVLAFTISGLGAALMGILIASRVAAAHPTQAEAYLMPSIATVFLGMTAFKRGQANIPGTIVGVLILGVLQNGLDITHVNSYVVEIVTGAVMLFAITFSQLAKKRA